MQNFFQPTLFISLPFIIFSRGTESLEKAMHKMENLIRHITTNCVKGFGYRWFDAFNRLGTGYIKVRLIKKQTLKLK